MNLKKQTVQIKEVLPLTHVLNFVTSQMTTNYFKIKLKQQYFVFLCLKWHKRTFNLGVGYEIEQFIRKLFKKKIMKIAQKE